VLELEDLEDGPLDVDVVAVLELVGAYDGESAPFAGKKRMWSSKGRVGSVLRGPVARRFVRDRR
jgi:hypothetical protein